MFRFPCTALVILPVVTAALLAGPKIEFDTKTVNCGVAIEGKTEKLNALFTVRNIGDSVLKIQNVRPGCGCTVVKFDSIVQPGKTAKIESKVNIKGYQSGPVSKVITVTSNAQNEPSVRLTIEATIQAIIDVSETYLNLAPANSTSPHAILLTTQKRDLKVTGVSFKLTENATTPGWQASLPITIKFDYHPLDSVLTDSSKVFKLDLYSPAVDKTVSGEFLIKTNHEDKPELSVKGTINK
jgi:hypothetical protein